MFLIGEDYFTVFDNRFNKVIGKLKLATQFLNAAEFSRDKTCLILQDKTHLYKYLLPEIKTIHNMKDTKIMIPYDMPNPEDDQFVLRRYIVAFEDRKIDIVDPKNYWKREPLTKADNSYGDIKLMKYDEESRNLFFIGSSLTMYNMETKEKRVIKKGEFQ